MSDLQGESSNFENRTTAIVADTGWYGLNDLMLNIHAPGVLGGPAPSVTVDGLLRPPSPLTRPGSGGSRIGASTPITHGAKRRTQALDGWRTGLDSSQDASPLRAIEVEALVWSTMTGPPEEDLSPAGGDDRFGSSTGSSSHGGNPPNRDMLKSMRDGDRRGSDMTATAAVRFLAHDIWDWGDSLARRIARYSAGVFSARAPWGLWRL